MNPMDRENIKSNLDKLAKDIIFDPNLINQMISKNIFSQPMLNDILVVSNEMERKKRFWIDFCRRGPNAVDQLVEILFGVGQESVAKVLRPDYFSTAKSDAEIVENITSSPMIERPPGPFPSQDAGDNAQPIASGTIAMIDNEDHMISVTQCTKGFYGPNIYKMSAFPRGYTLIFNIHKFIKDVYPERHGSQVEANRLRDVFTQLHFNVEMFDNLTKADIKKTIEEFRTSRELRRHDCLILIVLSHGHQGYCVGSDGMGLYFEDIVQKFNNENCPQLIGRPKLFFFSCCRGDFTDTGPKYHFENGEDAVSDAKTFSKSIVPTANDMMICYSTLDGYVSWRHEQNGSWFGTALCQSLMRHSHNEELHSVLTTTSAMITNKTTQNGEKQVMEHTFRGFRKTFYFNPGIPPNSSASDE